ncbi:MAG: hypothetical protein Q9222_007429 [Ikaeria aurantiellina]
MDDLYGDSPAMIKHQEDLVSQKITEITQSPPPQSISPTPQSPVMHLPGLGLSARRRSDSSRILENTPEESSELKGLQPSHPSIPHTAETIEASTELNESKTPPAFEMDQKSKKERTTEIEHDSQDGTNVIQEQDGTSAVATAAAEASPQNDQTTTNQPDVVAEPNSSSPSSQNTKDSSAERANVEQGNVNNETSTQLTPEQSGESGITKQHSDGKSLQEVKQTIERNLALNNALDLSPQNRTETYEGGPPEQTSDDRAVVLEEDDGASKDVAEEDEQNGEAEFELDSSPIESSSDSDSESSSSSSAESEYEMLDPAEEARRLMQEDGGSDDEGKGTKVSSGPLRTLNERPEEIIPKPEIEVTQDMAVVELGNVENVSENIILIRANASGESRALEIGSLLCLENRSVIGVVAEVLGQVLKPYYAVRFTNAAAITEAGISKGTTVYFVEKHSSYVFTQHLKALKGSDASNMHDEEVGDDELEFSDDEAEAEHKRRVKQEKQAKRGGRADRGDGYARGPRNMQRERGGLPNRPEVRSFGHSTINYDDNDDADDLYTPLARPSNLHEIMSNGEVPQDRLNHMPNGVQGSYHPARGTFDRGSGQGDRGRGRDSHVFGGTRRGGRGRGGAHWGGSHDRRYENRQEQYYNRATSPSRHAQPYPSYPSANSRYQPPSPPSNTWAPQYPRNQASPSSQPQQPYSGYHQPPYPQTHGSPHYPSAAPYSPVSHQSQYTQNNHQSHYSPSNPSAPHPYNHHYSPPQASSPTAPVAPNIPAGAHINPAFFALQAAQATPQYWQQQQQYPQNGSPQFGGAVNGGSPSQSGDAAFEFLRRLSRGGGGS